MIHRYFICLLISLFINSATIAQTAKFYTEVDAQEVLDGGYVEVSFVLENAKGDNFIPPDFSGFKLVNGPSTSSQISIANGVRSEKFSISYTLIADGVGTKRIGAASISANRKKLKTRTVDIKVVKASEKANAVEDDYYVQLELSDSTVYQGQQITLKYVLYSSKDVSSADFSTAFELEGFFTTRIRNYKDRAKRIVLNGKQYVQQTLKTISMFPMQTGTFKVNPTTVRLGFPDGRRRNSFFFNTREIKEDVYVEGKEIQVLATPTGAPVSFSGGVGKFSIQTSVDKRSITTNDAVTMRMQIKGSADPKTLEAPIQPVSNDWEFYDPNLINEESVAGGDQIISTKYYEYLMVPKRKGKLSIKPEFTYFDSDSLRYITLYGNTQIVNVIQGTGDSTLEDARQQEVAELAPIATTTKFSTKDKHFIYSPLYWILMAVPFLGMCALVVKKRKEIADQNIDPSLKRISEAEAKARARLSRAKTLMDNNNTKEFYSELNSALYGYVSDKLSIPASELSVTSIKQKLDDREISEEDVNAFTQLLNRVQMALYGAINDENLNQSYNDSVQAITNLDAYFR